MLMKCFKLLLLFRITNKFFILFNIYIFYFHSYVYLYSSLFDHYYQMSLMYKRSHSKTDFNSTHTHIHNGKRNATLERSSNIR